MGGIADAEAFSDEKLKQLRSRLKVLIPKNELVVTCGSYARREAGRGSDLDFYTILSGPSKDTEPPWFSNLEGAVKEIVGKLPSRGGAFAANIQRANLLRDYGGSRDSNATITRRMLYLLEGEYLVNEEEFRSIRRQIIERYVGNTPSDHQLAFYLLNDIIRYWRTMAVDYADKTYGAKEKKPWAIRNIKLVFSRKLIYASGLFSVALTADRQRHAKVEILEKLFSMTPIERIRYVCGEPSSKRLFEMYDLFLEETAKLEVRKHLEELPRDSKDTDAVFRRLKNEGHYFSRELMGLFHRTFHASHPIHMAVIF
ncbi:MAG: nucleotidyltransferase domain-containing protein [Allosphingosinicella sp.]